MAQGEESSTFTFSSESTIATVSLHSIVVHNTHTHTHTQYLHTHAYTHTHTHIQTKTLQKFISAEVEFDLEIVQSLLEPLLRDKTAGSYSSLALQDLTTVVEHLTEFGAKEPVS